MLDPSFKACKTVALLPQKMWDDEFWCVVGADTTVCRRGLILPGLRRYQQSLTLNCVVPALKCLILPVWNLLKTQGLIHFWGGCWRQMKDAAVSSPELLILKKKKTKKTNPSCLNAVVAPSLPSLLYPSSVGLICPTQDATAINVWKHARPFSSLWLRSERWRRRQWGGVCVCLWEGGGGLLSSCDYVFFLLDPSVSSNYQ